MKIYAQLINLYGKMMIDRLILMACQPFQGYFMTRDLFIASLYFCVVISWDLVWLGFMVYQSLWVI